MPESDTPEAMPAIELIERRRRPRPGDSLPAPVFVAEGNSEEDWVLWEHSQALHDLAMREARARRDAD